MLKNFKFTRTLILALIICISSYPMAVSGVELTTSKEIFIDLTAPLEPVLIAGGIGNILDPVSNGDCSGINRVEVKKDNGDAEVFTETSLPIGLVGDKSSGYTLEYDYIGAVTIVVAVYDNVGNLTQTTFEFTSMDGSLVIVPSTITLLVGDTKQLQAYLDESDVTADSDWDTGNGIISSVQSGLVTGLSAGETIITALHQQFVDMVLTVNSGECKVVVIEKGKEDEPDIPPVDLPPTLPGGGGGGNDWPWEPPVVEPPVVEPPVVEPPVVEPPVVEPPVVEPPVVEPPVVEPPAVEPPAVEPPAVEPPVVEPPAVEPPVVEPPAVEPPVVDSISTPATSVRTDKPEPKKDLVEHKTKLGIIKGVLLQENNKPFANVRLELYSNPRATFTNENGEFIFENVELGEHKLYLADKKISENKKLLDIVVVEATKNVVIADIQQYNVQLSDEESEAFLVLKTVLSGEKDKTPSPDKEKEKVLSPYWVLLILLMLLLLLLLLIIRRREDDVEEEQNN